MPGVGGLGEVGETGEKGGCGGVKRRVSGRVGSRMYSEVREER